MGFFYLSCIYYFYGFHKSEIANVFSINFNSGENLFLNGPASNYWSSALFLLLESTEICSNGGTSNLVLEYQ
jgi:hypothetical protein